MKKVLHIGQVDFEGHFGRNTWEAIVLILSHWADTILVYTKQPQEWLQRTCGEECAIAAVPFPDKSAAMHGYRLVPAERGHWVAFARLPCDPEMGLSHIYFFEGDTILGELEVEDGENFVVLKDDLRLADNVFTDIPEAQHNETFCALWSNAIDELVGDSDWKPVGRTY